VKNGFGIHVQVQAKKLNVQNIPIALHVLEICQINVVGVKTPTPVYKRIKSVPISRKTKLVQQKTHALTFRIIVLFAQQTKIWCNSTLCVEGSLNGPSFANCTKWSFQNCTKNDTCPLYTDCLSCLNLNEGSCGWCENGASSGCMDTSDHSSCEGQWKTMQCTAYVFTCSSLTTCEDCVNYPPGECVWCGQEGACRLAIDVGTSCQYSCGQNMALGPGVIAALVIVGVSILGLGFGLWYRFYWVKRHYYERLR